jgi:hypothetical protein
VPGEIRKPGSAKVIALAVAISRVPNMAARLPGRLSRSQNPSTATVLRSGRFQVSSHGLPLRPAGEPGRGTTAGRAALTGRSWPTTSTRSPSAPDETLRSAQSIRANLLTTQTAALTIARPCRIQGFFLGK